MSSFLRSLFEFSFLIIFSICSDEKMDSSLLQLVGYITFDKSMQLILIIDQTALRKTSDKVLRVEAI